MRPRSAADSRTLLLDASGHGNDGVFDTPPFWIPSGRLGTIPTPVLTVLPTNLSVFEGGTALFEVASTTPDSLVYQWRFDGTDIAGATGHSLLLTNVQLSQAGEYSVTAQGPSGSIVSSPATLTVRAFTSPPIADARLLGGRLAFTVPSEPGLRYTIEFKDAIDEPAWRPLLTQTGDGTPFSLTETNESGRTRFYRVRIEMP